MTIQLASLTDVTDIVLLQRTESNRLGFLPRTAIRQHVERGWCFTARYDGRVIGYILGWHQLRYNPEIRGVTQLIVLRRFQRHRIATALVSHWMEKAIIDGKTIVQAWTREDLYAAHALWKSLKWTAICRRTPTTARGKPATLYRVSLTNIPSPRFHEIPRRGGWNAAAISPTREVHDGDSAKDHPDKSQSDRAAAEK